MNPSCAIVGEGSADRGKPVQRPPHAEQAITGRAVIDKRLTRLHARRPRRHINRYRVPGAATWIDRKFPRQRADMAAFGHHTLPPYEVARRPTHALAPLSGDLTGCVRPRRPAARAGEATTSGAPPPGPPGTEAPSRTLSGRQFGRVEASKCRRWCCQCCW